MKCCVYTRFYYEGIFLKSFIQHYIELGFDLIIVLFHDITMFEIPELYKSKVLLIDVPNYGNYLPDMFRNHIPKDIDWVLHVDSDEFLFIHEKFPNIKTFIKSKLDYNPAINVFAFLWAWVHNLDPEKLLSLNIKKMISSSKVFVGRRLYQKTIKNDELNNKEEIWLKSMFRRDLVKDLAVHMPILKIPYIIYTPNNEIIEYDDMMHRIKTLSYNSDFWEDGFYNETCLIHLATRDIYNLIFKSLNIHSSQMKKKNIKNKKKFIEGIKNIDLRSSYDMFLHFVKTIGYKFEFPFKCEDNLNLANFELNKFNPKLSDDIAFNVSSCDFSYYYDFHTFRYLIHNTEFMLATNMIVEEYNNIFNS